MFLNSTSPTVTIEPQAPAEPGLAYEKLPAQLDRQRRWQLLFGGLLPGGATQDSALQSGHCDLHGRTSDDFLTRVKGLFKTSQEADPSPTSRGHVVLYLAGQSYGLEIPPVEGNSPSSKLDVAILQSKLLEPLLNIDDPRTSKRIDFRWRHSRDRGTREDRRLG